MLEVLEQVAGEPELRCRDRVAARELEGERGLAVVEHEPVVLGELVARLPGAERRRSPRPRRPEIEHVLAGVEPGAWRSPTTRPASSTSASEQPTCSPTIASSAGAPRPSRTAWASRSCTSSARSTRASCSFASCAEIAFVSAMNGTS